jgi:hypothetical protein
LSDQTDANETVGDIWNWNFYHLILKLFRFLPCVVRVVKNLNCAWFRETENANKS